MANECVVLPMSTVTQPTSRSTGLTDAQLTPGQTGSIVLPADMSLRPTSAMNNLAIGSQFPPSACPTSPAQAAQGIVFNTPVAHAQVKPVYIAKVIKP